MTSYVTLQRSLHLDAGYAPLSDYLFAAGRSTVPLLKEELSNVLQFMSMGFQKRKLEEADFFELVGIQSLLPDMNMFLRPNGRWLVGYQPAFYRGQPFTLLPGEKNTQMQLGIRSDLIKVQPAENDTRFFEKDGALTPRLQNVAKFLGESLRSRLVTQRLCRALQDAGLIVPWPIQFTRTDENQAPSTSTLNGLYHIDAKALRELPAQQLAPLHASGALEIAYAQLFSEVRLKDLQGLHNVHARLLAKQSRQNAPLPEPDLDELFGNKDDLFSF
jgi:hypothetical protein